MTTKDSAGDKLVASIRKTKSGASTNTPAIKKRVVKKAAQTTRKKVTPVKERATTSDSKKQLVNLFNSGRRVWPD